MSNNIIISSGKYKLQKLTKSQVRKTITTNNVFHGFMCGNKVNPYHIATGWYLGHQIELTSIDEFDVQIGNLEVSLLMYTPELGNRVHFYQIISEI